MQNNGSRPAGNSNRTILGKKWNESRQFVVGNTDEDGRNYRSVLIGCEGESVRFRLLELGDADLYRMELIKKTPHLGPQNGQFDSICRLADFLHYGNEVGEVECGGIIPEIVLPEAMIACLAIHDPNKQSIDIWMKCFFQVVARDKRLGIPSGESINPFLYAGP